jgi:hypothetical protein
MVCQEANHADGGEYRVILRDLTDNYVQQHQLETVDVAKPLPVARIFMESESDEVSGLLHVLCPLTSICIQILSENTRSVVPTKTQYIMATGKQTLELLHSAASLIPVPLLQDVIRVAIKIIETCEVREFLYSQTTRFTYDMYLSGGISCPTKGQRAPKQG